MSGAEADRAADDLSGISHDAGFSLNVANFYTTTQSIAYGRELSTLVGDKHFVIDTSRNGNGAPPGGAGVNEWCNPSGRALVPRAGDPHRGIGGGRVPVGQVPGAVRRILPAR